jgi:hypothetical protein
LASIREALHWVFERRTARAERVKRLIYLLLGYGLILAVIAFTLWITSELLWHWGFGSLCSPSTWLLERLFGQPTCDLFDAFRT